MAEARVITGRHVLLALLAFFGVIIVANTIFITLALRSFPGEAEKKSYMQGLRYNEVIAERAQQEALGWRAEVTRVDRNEDIGVIEIRFEDAVERPLRTLSVAGVLQRPAHNGEDVAVNFEALGSGAYRAHIEGLSPGAWDLSARAEKEGGAYFDVEARLIVP